MGVVTVLMNGKQIKNKTIEYDNPQIPMKNNNPLSAFKKGMVGGIIPTDYLIRNETRISNIKKIEKDYK